jgi:DNA-binding transcriptional MerR regulator
MGETMMNRAAVTIPEKLFFKIGEVCDIVGIQAHVLRYWESEFSMLAPQKNRAGQRTYRKRDVEMVLRIKELLYEEQYTIPGARKRLVADVRGASKLKVVTPEMTAGANALTDATSYAAPSPSQFSPAPTFDSHEREYAAPVVAELADDGDSPGNAVNHQTLPADQRHAIRRLRTHLHDLLALLEDEGR